MPWIQEAFIQTKANRTGGCHIHEREGKIALSMARINGKTYRSVEAIMNGWGE